MGTHGERHGGEQGLRLVLDSYARLSRNVSDEWEKGGGAAHRQPGGDRASGWGAGVELTGDDLSAWKPAVRRPDWERLLAPVGFGRGGGVAGGSVDAAAA
ncbi:MAG: hypothetical protein ACRDTT_07810 [Pseudonocardiaceae bacterium]